MPMVHLHVHDNYSPLEGMGEPKDYVAMAKVYGQKALAITNTGNLFNAYTFLKECKSGGIKPILGIEFYMAESDDMKLKDSPNQQRLVALAKNQAGWNNLMKLSTISFMEGRYYKPRIDSKTLFANKEGLIILSAGLSGQIGTAWGKGDERRALEIARSYKKEFGDDFYLEIIPVDSNDQAELNAFLFSISKSDGFQITVGNDCRFPTQDKAEFYAYLDQIRAVGRGGYRPNLPTERYFKGEEEMLTALVNQGFHPALAGAWVNRTAEIADSIEPVKFSDAFKIPVFFESNVQIAVMMGSALGIGDENSIEDADEGEEGGLFDDAGESADAGTDSEPDADTIAEAEKE
jgi:DNA polymerase-3 subunit alpha